MHKELKGLGTSDFGVLSVSARGEISPKAFVWGAGMVVGGGWRLAYSSYFRYPSGAG